MVENGTAKRVVLVEAVVEVEEVVMGRVENVQQQ